MKTTLACALVIASVTTVFAQEPPRVVTQSTPQGRFQIVFSPFVRADTYLLDTQTGRIWQQVKWSEGESSVWHPMTRLDTPEEIAMYYNAHKKNAPSPTSQSPGAASQAASASPRAR